MATGLHVKDIIRIGYLNIHADERMEEYLSLYDIVIINDGSLSTAQMLVDLISGRDEWTYFNDIDNSDY